MSTRRSLHLGALTLISALSLALPRLAQADVVFSDGSLSDWSTSWVQSGSCSSVMNTQHPSSGGNAGAYLQFSQGGCNQFVQRHLSTFTWNPSTQGAIASMTIGYDAQWQSGAFAGWDTRIGVNALIRQNGTDYFAVSGEVASPSWSHFSADIFAVNWVTLGGGGGKPDFSGTGGLIEFGIATSNNCPSCYKQLSGGLDNYAVTLHGVDAVASVPEPTSLALFGVAALGLAATRRRRVG